MSDLNAEALRNIADWLDTYDDLAKQYFDLLVVQGLRSDDEVAAARAACDSDEIQVDLRRWADELETGEK
jgi:hypothetical protein